MAWRERIRKVIGDDVDYLASCKVAVIGLGGVGGMAVEALARSGVGQLLIADFDVYNPTNLNRQVIATREGVGELKTTLALRRIKDINPECEVEVWQEKMTETIPNILDQYSVVIDAVDDVAVKLSLIAWSQSRSAHLLVSLGMGNRVESEGIEICSLSDTYNDPLARKIRKRLSRMGVDCSRVEVIFSPILPRRGAGAPGSLIFAPATAGLLAAQWAVKTLLRRGR